MFGQAVENRDWVEGPLAFLGNGDLELVFRAEKSALFVPVVGERAARMPRGRVRQHKAAASVPALIDISCAEIDTAFYGLTLGVQSPIDCYLNEFEKNSAARTRSIADIEFCP